MEETKNAIEVAIERKAQAERLLEELEEKKKRAKEVIGAMDAFLATAEDLTPGVTKKLSAKVGVELTPPAQGTATRTTLQRGAWAAKAFALLSKNGTMKFTAILATLKDDPMAAGKTGFRQTLGKALTKRSDIFALRKDGLIELLVSDVELVERKPK